MNAKTGANRTRSWDPDPAFPLAGTPTDVAQPTSDQFSKQADCPVTFVPSRHRPMSPANVVLFYFIFFFFLADVWNDLSYGLSLREKAGFSFGGGDGNP